jgi:hypothetical protein
MKCRVALVFNFPLAVRTSCAGLCWPGSEMQAEFADGSSTPVSVVFCGGLPTAWAATHRWRDMQTLEGFTHYRYRRRGLQRFAASGLLAAGLLDTSKPVAVFSPDCVGLTRSLGFVDVKLFRRSDSGDWVPL